jgi:hypothetical protein
MGLTDDVRRSCREIAESARFVAIDLDRLGEVSPAPPPALDPERHFLEGSAGEVASYLLTLDAINFGSGWFPTLRKRPGCSGYFTVAWSLADRFRARGPFSNAELRALEAAEIATVLGQPADHELMAHCARSGPSSEPEAHCSWSVRPAGLRSGSPRCWPAACRSSTTSASGSALRSCRTT